MELLGAIQTYDWGKLGKTSKVALLHSSNDPQFVIDEKSTYAELWMGTHCNGPSILKNTGQKLKDNIVENEKYIGNEVMKQFGKDLPFLFKVLSVNKALSIQAHPSKEHAEQLHKSHPDIYKDPNHKPELAIALSQFEALCGFRPVAEIKRYLQEIPQLQEVIGKDTVSTFLKSSIENEQKEMLKKCFEQLMKCPTDVVGKQLSFLMNNLKKDEDNLRLSELMSTLHSQYPGDVGCFCIYFLNYIVLSPGECIYLGPNVPHAYLSGDCIECMANSDNVVRAGLTPKYRDVDTLCDMLDYSSMTSSSVLFQPCVEDEFTSLYQPQIPDFAVACITIPQSSQYYTSIPRNSASIMLIVEGDGNYNAGECKCKASELKTGSILFIPAKEKLTITNKTTLTIYQAFANV